MSRIDCIIIEDEPLAAKVLKDYITEVAFLNWKGTFKNAIQALEYLMEHEADLIFLDIHLPKLKGIDFLKTLTQQPEVIITTAYQQYALQGYDLNVTDYLLKPIEFERFLQAVNKVETKAKTEAGKKHNLFINVQKRKVKVLFSDILFVESQREYVKIVTKEKEILTKVSTSEMEKQLPADRFRRIHRSFIVAMNKIEAFTSEAVEIQGRSIPVGRKYKRVVEEL